MSDIINMDQAKLRRMTIGELIDKCSPPQGQDTRENFEQVGTILLLILTHAQGFYRWNADWVLHNTLKLAEMVIDGDGIEKEAASEVARCLSWIAGNMLDPEVRLDTWDAETVTTLEAICNIDPECRELYESDCSELAAAG